MRTRMPHPAADRGSAAIALTAGAAVVMLLAAALIGGVAGVSGQEASACQAQPAASTAAASIPADYLSGYQKAGAAYGIPWTVLAGVGTVESDNGQSHLPGVHSGTNAYGAAVISGWDGPLGTCGLGATRHVSMRYPLGVRHVLYGRGHGVPGGAGGLTE